MDPFGLEENTGVNGPDGQPIFYNQGVCYQKIFDAQGNWIQSRPVPCPAGDTEGTPVVVPETYNSIECRDEELVVKIGSPEGADECTRAHEEKHISDWRKRYGWCLCKGVPDGQLPVGGDEYTEFLEKSECEAHRIGLACRENLIREGNARDPEKTKRKIEIDKALIRRYCRD
jgi:hypothetical protein